MNLNYLFGYFIHSVTEISIVLLGGEKVPFTSVNAFFIVSTFFSPTLAQGMQGGIIHDGTLTAGIRVPTCSFYEEVVPFQSAYMTR